MTDYNSLGRYKNPPDSTKINYNKLLESSRNEMMKQCLSKNNLIGNSNLSYESNRSIDGLQKSQFVSRGGKKSQQNNRKSMTNLVPFNNKKPKFIFKRDGKNNKSNMRQKDFIMNNYLKQFSCGNDENIHPNNRSNVNGRPTVDPSQLSDNRSKSSLNLSRGISNSSKKSIQEKKECFQDRVKKLKNKLCSTKNSNRAINNLSNTHYNNTSLLKADTCGIGNYRVVRDGNMSPTSLGANSSYIYFLILMELWGPYPVSYTSVD